jgi:hypothetical protein
VCNYLKENADAAAEIEAKLRDIMLPKKTKADDALEDDVEA